MIALSGFDRQCTVCKNSSVFINDIYIKKWFIFRKYTHTEYRCYVCKYVNTNQLSVKRMEALNKLGI
jgi:hypothetical protein